MTPFLSAPPEPKSYYNQVWALVRKIPVGKVATYGQIAGMLLSPSGVSEEDYRVSGPRWVGLAMARCPEDVPWQRVVNAQGKISLRGGEGGKIQQQLLETEGVDFDARQRIDLSRFGWDGTTR